VSAEPFREDAVDATSKTMLADTLFTDTRRPVTRRSKPEQGCGRTPKSVAMTPLSHGQPAKDVKGKGKAVEVLDDATPKISKLDIMSLSSQSARLPVLYRPDGRSVYV
jgi:hypothetical protein